MYRLLLFISIVLTLTSCVYFNMYFNGKEHFEKGEEKYKQTRKVTKSDYNNSIEELSKILEFYPEDDMVDDALLLMGRCYYRLENYLKSRRKFNELINNYPNSELVPKAKIWLSEVEIKLGEYETVNKLLSDIKPDSSEASAMKTYLKLMGDLKLSQKDSVAAKDFYIKASSYEENSDEKEELVKIAAFIAESKRLFKDADRNYLMASEITTSREQKVYYLLKHGEMLQARGLTDSAVGIYNGMLNDGDLEKYYPNIDFNLAKIHFLAKDYDKAYEKFNDIVHSSRKNEGKDSILAESSYYIGEYLLLVKKELDNASAYYDSVTYFYSKSESRVKSKERSRSIFNKNKYKKIIDDAIFSIDSLKEEISEYNEEKAASDSVDFSLTKYDMASQLKRYEKRVADLNYKIADIFINQLNLNDSSFTYLDKGKEYTQFPHISSKCEYLLMDQYRERNFGSKADSIENFILSTYPKTRAANFIRERKGLEKFEVVEDTLTYIYNKASDHIISEEYEEADKLLAELIKKSRGESIHPKVLLSAAVLNENYLLNSDKAIEYYSLLKKDYYKKSEGIFAKNKLRLSDEPIEKAKVIEEAKQLDEFEMWQLMDRRVE